MMLDSLLVPTAIVALAEIGDKTQLLALILAARFRKPWPIIAGIVAATLANHAAALRCIVANGTEFAKLLQQFRGVQQGVWQGHVGSFTGGWL